MSEFNRKHPEMAAKLMTLIESGLNPDEIIAKFKSDDESKELDSEKEVFPGEIKLISQALAYRPGVKTDTSELFEMFLGAYSNETTGAESFRKGPAISKSVVRDLLSDSAYKWLIVEAPSGRGIERDGVILGACCYSTDGVSRRNGVIEGTLGSVRLFGVLPRYHGFCVGHRLLQKVEDVIFAAGCCRLMACVPSPRTTILKWIERRHYTRLGSCRYPAASIGHVITLASEVELVQYVKTKPSILSENDTADDKTTKVYSLVHHNEHSIECTTTVSEEVQNFSDVTVRVSDMGSAANTSGGDSDVPGQQQDSKKMILPPLWRHLNKPSPVASTLSEEVVEGGSVSISLLSLSSDSKQPTSADCKRKVQRFTDSGFLESDIPGVD